MSQDALRITAKKEGSDEPGDIIFLCHNTTDKSGRISPSPDGKTVTAS